MDNNQYPTQPTETAVEQVYQTQPVNVQPAGQVVTGGSKVLSIISLVCGISAMVFCYIPFLGLMCGIAAIILSSIARKKGANGMNKTGLILGIIGTVLGAIMTVVMLAAAGASSTYSSYDYYDYYYTAIVRNLLK